MCGTWGQRWISQCRFSWCGSEPSCPPEGRVEEEQSGKWATMSHQIDQKNLQKKNTTSPWPSLQGVWLLCHWGTWLEWIPGRHYLIWTAPRWPVPDRNRCQSDSKPKAGTQNIYDFSILIKYVFAPHFTCTRFFFFYRKQLKLCWNKQHSTSCFMRTLNWQKRETRVCGTSLSSGKLSCWQKGHCHSPVASLRMAWS